MLKFTFKKKGKMVDCAHLRCQVHDLRHNVAEVLKLTGFGDYTEDKETQTFENTDATKSKDDFNEKDQVLDLFYKFKDDIFHRPNSGNVVELITVYIPELHKLANGFGFELIFKSGFF